LGLWRHHGPPWGQHNPHISECWKMLEVNFDQKSNRSNCPTSASWKCSRLFLCQDFIPDPDVQSTAAFKGGVAISGQRWSEWSRVGESDSRRVEHFEAQRVRKHQQACNIV
jgi:hypothetical protein